MVPLQSEAAECGVVCVALITAMYGKEISAAAVKERFGISTRGIAVSQLITILRAAGFQASAVLVDFSRPSAICEPCIALRDRGHFIVLGRRRGKLREIFDPESGWEAIEEADLPSRLEGPVVEIRGVPDIPTIRSRTPLSLRRWLAPFKFVRRLVPMTALALLTQALLLLTPLLAKGVLDGAKPGSSVNTLVLAVGAFAGLALFGVLARNAARRLAARVSGRLGTELVADVSARILSLPVHILGRFAPETLTGKVHTVRLIQESVLRLGGTTFVLCVVAIVALIIVAILHPLFATVLVASGIVGFVLDRWLVATVSAAADRLHRASVIQTAGLNEMSKAAPAIASYGAGAAVLAKRVLETRAVEQATIRLDDAKRLRDSSKSVILLLDHSVFLGLGAWLLSRGQMSFGDFVALGLYRELVNVGVHELRDALAEVRVLNHAKARLEDLVLAPKSSVDRTAFTPDGPFGVTLRGVSFRYSAFDPWIFSHANLHVAPGESVAIVGPSGCGKSTLAKLIVGALSPEQGTIEIGGVELRPETHAKLVNHFGTVMQFDHLLSASVAENIAFFRDVSLEDIRAAAEFAEIAETIEAMPMKYETPISDAFAGLSGGQRQRILIARAVCSGPQLLVMDEATSFLDHETEASIAKKVRSLGVTRIIFAHREETIRTADRVLEIQHLVGQQHTQPLSLTA